MRGLPPALVPQRASDAHNGEATRQNTTTTADLTSRMGVGAQTLGLGLGGLRDEEVEAGHILCHGLLPAPRLPQGVAQIVPLL